MCIQTAASYLVSARLGNHGLAETCHHRPHQHDGTAQAGTFFQERVTFQIGEINVGSLKAVSVNAFFRYADSHIPHQLDKVVDVQYVRDIVHSHLFGSEQCGADNLQHLVFCSLGVNVTGKSVSSFDYK